jgi:hypothetical protein
LFFGYTTAGGFTFNLSSIIYTASTTISLSGASVTGYLDSSCTQVNGADAVSAETTIAAGTSNASVAGNGLFNDPYYEFDNYVVVNSTGLNHNSTIVIGNTTVTIKLPQGCNIA